MSNWYHLYCDEAGIGSGPSFDLGALQMSPARAAILTAGLSRVRDDHGHRAEMKWTKVSRAMLDAYKSFVDVFLNCPYTRLFHLRVHKQHDWTAFGRSEDVRFFKSYYVFLRMNMRSHSRYLVQVDDKPGKRYRWR